MKRRMVPIVVVALGVAALAWWFANFERVDTSVHVGLSGKAREDPYLAFKRLLDATGWRFEQTPAGMQPATAIATLPPKGTLVLLARREVLMTPERVAALMRWVEAGGHLVAAAEPVARPDPLLAAVNVGRTGPQAPAASSLRETPAGASPMTRGGAPLAAAFPGRKRAMAVAITAPVVLQDLRGAADWRGGDRHGTRMLSMPRGKGRVSVAADLAWIAFRGAGNAGDAAQRPVHIGSFDHAEAIVALLELAPGSEHAPVRMMGGVSSLSLADWLAAHAWPALAALVTLLLLWLWRVMPRFGPLAAAPPAAEQSLARHLEASGRFYRRHMPIEEIHAGLARQFVHRLAERRPGLAARGAAERNEALARLAGLKTQQVARALDAPCRAATEFTQAAATIKRLEQVI